MIDTIRTWRPGDPGAIETGSLLPGESVRVEVVPPVGERSPVMPLLAPGQWFRNENDQPMSVRSSEVRFMEATDRSYYWYDYEVTVGRFR